MKFILIGLVRYFYIAITGVPVLFIGLIYAIGGGDISDFLKKWLSPVFFGDGEK